MGAGWTRWWDPEVGKVRTVVRYAQRERELYLQGFLPFSDRTHTRMHLEAAGVPIVERVDSWQNAHSNQPTRRAWVPAWCEALMEPTFGAAGAEWRREMARYAQHDPEFRAAAIAVLELAGADALQAFVESQREVYAAELRRVEDEINAAYWRFTRCKRAKPPVLQVPGAYERRKALRTMLRLPAMRPSALA